MNSVRALTLFAAAFLFPSAVLAQGGAKALTCFFQEDLENGLPPSWDIGAQVERQNADGDSLGEFVPAWTIGNSAQANANGHFPVTDQPLGNHFAMANDDAAPCNCTMADVNLTTPGLDLSGRTNVGLQGRLFNDGFGGGGAAYVLASRNGTDWDTVFTAPPAAAWVAIVADLSAYDGEPSVRIRFNWSDGGRWAGGFAVDDICIGERFMNDLSILAVHSNDATASPFTAGDQTLRYRQLPLEQMAPLRPSVHLRNTGSAAATAVTASISITLNSTEVYAASGVALSDLAAGAESTFVFVTGWTAVEPGDVSISITVSTPATDEDLTDNTASTSMEITGPGWENGYRVMAADEGDPQVGVGGSNAFIAASRMEVVHEGSTIKGISAAITTSSSVGAQVRAILLDGNLAFVDTSTRRTLTQEDLDLVAANGALYLPLSFPSINQPGDYFAGIQHLDGDGEVFVWCSGERPAGSDVLMQGTNFETTYLPRTPMVRLHFEDFGVGLHELGPTTFSDLRVFPVPMTDMGWAVLQTTKSGTGTLRIMDMSGRVMTAQDLGALPAGANRIALPTQDLVPGMYVVELRVGDASNVAQIVVER